MASSSDLSYLYLFISRFQETRLYRAHQLVSYKMADTSISNQVAASSDLCFQNLPNYLPRELREKVYIAYFEAPYDHFTNLQGSRIYQATKALLEDSEPEIFAEILFTISRIPSKPQHVLLNSNREQTAEFEGFPKPIMTNVDWLNVQYLVIKIVYYDCSFREDLDSDITRSVYISIPHDMGKALTRIFAIQDANSHISHLTKVRYDMVYDDSHAGGEKAAIDAMIAKTLTAGERVTRDPNEVHTNLVLPLSDLIKYFPLAKNVWAEASGSIENPRALQTVRAFNVGRQVFQRCHPYPPGVLSMVTGMAASSGEKGGFEDGEARNKEWAGKAVEMLEAIKADDLFVEAGIDIEILCEGCQAKFKGEYSLEPSHPEQRPLTKQLYNDHRLRSLHKYGRNSPCATHGMDLVAMW